MPALSLCVYCGSRDGALPDYADAARAIGREIGQRGWQLVYGGGRAGLMGTVADAALAAGASVVGVIPQTLMEREVGHGSLTELHVVKTMHERKQLMAQRSDAFVALPGGIGTFEELFETWTWRQLGYHDKPMGLLDVAGYFRPMLAFLQQTVTQGFLSPQTHGLLEVDEQIGPLLDRLERQVRLATGAGDYGRI